MPTPTNKPAQTNAERQAAYRARVKAQKMDNLVHKLRFESQLNKIMGRNISILKQEDLTEPKRICAEAVLLALLEMRREIDAWENPEKYEYVRGMTEQDHAKEELEQIILTQVVDYRPSMPDWYKEHFTGPVDSMAYGLMKDDGWEGNTDPNKQGPLKISKSKQDNIDFKAKYKEQLDLALEKLITVMETYPADDKAITQTQAAIHALVALNTAISKRKQ